MWYGQPSEVQFSRRGGIAEPKSLEILSLDYCILLLHGYLGQKVVPGAKSGTWGKKWYLGQKVVPGAKSGTWGKKWYLGQKVVPGAKSGTWGKKWYLGQKVVPGAKSGTVNTVPCPTPLVHSSKIVLLDQRKPD